jgi:two-component system cell cycle sensor histidine kinase/response regulator CckA
MRDLPPTWDEPGLFRFVFESVVDAVIVTDASGEIVLANAAARRMPGVAPGRPLSLPGAVDDDVALFRAELRARGRAKVELRLDEKRASARHVVIEATVHDGHDVFIVRDVSDARKNDEELRHLRRVDSLGYLTASVVHDFNNLLTPIVCLSALLERGLTNAEPAADMVRDVRIASERAAALVRQLLTFLRRDSARPQRVNLTDVAREVDGLLRRVVGDGIDVSFALESELGETVVDREQLEHVILNLAANARDAMPRGGALTIATANVAAGDSDACPDSGAYVALTVTDTGTGMSPEVRERLFERFFTTKEVGSGTGLGLASAHRFVTASGGCITVRSEAGQGTTVVLYLPRAAAAELPSERRPAVDDLPSGSETILVVEDDEHVRRVVRAVLEELGYRVLAVADAEGALRETARHAARVDLVLVDVVLAGGSGRALVDELREAGHGMKVLFMSGHTDKVLGDHGVHEALDPLLRKAFSPTELSHAVREVLDGKRVEQTSAA